MASVKERSIIEDESFVMIMWISRIFGIAPVRFTTTRGTTVMYVSRLVFIYGVVITIAFNIEGIHSFLLKLEINPVIEPKKNTTLMATAILSTTFVVSYGVFCGVKRSKCFIYCIDQIHKIKKSICNDYEPDSTKVRYLFIIFFYLTAIWILGFLDMWAYAHWNNVRSYFHYILVIILTMMEIQFFVVAMSVKSALKIINENLNDLLTKIHQDSEIEDTWAEKFLIPNALKIPVKSINVTIDMIGMADQMYPDVEIEQRLKIANKIRQITHSFVSTCDVVREFNDCESVILFLQLGLFCLDLVVTANNFLRSIQVAESSGGFLSIIQCGWFLYHIMRILMVVEPCCSTQEELINTRFLTARIMCYVVSEVDTLRDEIDDFCKQLMLNDVSYSAMGICSIGRPLISTIIGSVTTILVLVYEF